MRAVKEVRATPDVFCVFAENPVDADIRVTPPCAETARQEIICPAKGIFLILRGSQA